MARPTGDQPATELAAQPAPADVGSTGSTPPSGARADAEENDPAQDWPTAPLIDAEGREFTHGHDEDGDDTD